MELWDEIQKLPQLLYLLGKKDSGAISKLDELLFAVYGNRLDRHCTFCINKAYQKLTNLTLEKLTEMKDQKYKLKAGVVVYFQHTHFTNDNITDDIAQEMVSVNKANADLFETAPEVKEKPVKKGKEATTKEDNTSAE